MSTILKERAQCEALLRDEEDAVRAFSGRFGTILDEARQDVSRRWPELPETGADEFVRRAARSLARRFLDLEQAGGEMELEELLARLHLSDLFLVSSMESGCEEAWRAFHRTFERDLTSTVQAFIKNRSLRSEVLEDLDGDLFSAGRGSRGLLATYMGTGPLGGWLRTVLYRRALALSRKRARAPGELRESEENAHTARSAARENADADILPRDLMEVFVAAVRDAFGTLDARDRSLLLLRYTRGVSQKQLSRAMGWSEVKTSRHFQHLRQNLLTEIQHRTGLSRKEFDEHLPAIRGSAGSLARGCFFENRNFDDISLLADLGVSRDS